MKSEKPKKEEVELQGPIENNLDTQLDTIANSLIEMASNKEGGITEEEVGQLATTLDLINQKPDEEYRIASKEAELEKWRRRIHGSEAKNEAD